MSEIGSVASARPSRTRRAIDFIRDVADTPGGKFGVVVVLGLIIVIVFAPWLAPYSPTEQDIPERFQGPSAAHLLGTDELGRDLLSRVIYGARIALGVTAGYLGGAIDRGFVVVIDALGSVPAVILALAVIALLGPSVNNLVIVLRIAFAPGYAGVIRAWVRSPKRRSFVEAERALGASRWRIVRLHVVPNLFAPILVLMAMDLPTVIAAEAGLSFFGLGVPPPAPSWGVMLSTGFDYVRESPWTLLAASMALAITTIGITLFGESLRDVVDPKLAGTRRGRAT